MKMHFCLALLCLTLVSCATSDEKKVETQAALAATPTGPVRIHFTPEQLRRSRVSTAAVERRSLAQQIQTGGQVQSAANRTLQVATAVDGLVEQVNVQAGDSVRTGQVLAVLKSDQVSQIESELLQNVLGLDADRKQAQVQVDLTRNQLAREQRLFEARVSARADLEVSISENKKALATRESLDSKRHALITATSERLRLLGVPTTEAARIVADHRVDDRLYIRARRDGIITDRSVNPGELVDADDSKPMFAIADLSRVWLVGQVFEQDIPRVHIGLPVNVSLDSYPGRVFRGQLDYVASALDPATRTLSVRATVDNPGGRLKPAMFARMAIATGSTSVLSVPVGAVQKSGEIYVAYVPLGNDNFEERQVTIGRSFGAFIEVLTGLKSGEKVVDQGSLQLQGQAQQLTNQ